MQRIHILHRILRSRGFHDNFESYTMWSQICRKIVWYVSVDPSSQQGTKVSSYNSTISTVGAYWFLRLAIPNAKILIYFSNIIYGSNFFKRHLGTVVVRNYQNADCSLKNKFIVLFTVIFGTFVPYCLLSFHS